MLIQIKHSVQKNALKLIQNKGNLNLESLIINKIIEKEVKNYNFI